MQILIGGVVALMTFRFCHKVRIGLTRSIFYSYSLAAVIWIIGDLFFGRVVFFQYFSEEIAMRSVNPITATEEEVGPLTYLGHKLILAWYCFVVVTMVLPYLLYGEIRDTALRAVKHDVVWVQEMNPYIYGGAYPNRSPGDVDPPFPLCIERENHGPKNYYAKLGSVREAEDWLLAHGYKKRLVSHVCAPDTFCSKTMPVSMVTKEQESIVNVILDYGDGDLHFLVFRYPEGKSPLDLSRFEQAQAPDNRFKIVWASTDHLPWYVASHMWGGHIRKGYPGESLRD